LHDPRRAAIRGIVIVLPSRFHEAALHRKAWKLRAIGISSTRRSPILPEVPAIAEGGYPGYEATGQPARSRENARRHRSEHERAPAIWLG
jgi:tripartite-type tricarboxylate transporter receptor subunit TctC